MRLTKGEVAAVAMFIAFVALVAAAVMLLCPDGRNLNSTWPESAEFSQLMTGQDRFSEHETNLGRWVVVVDHQTGVQYLAEVRGRAVCPLLSADGSPLLVAEAGE